jgi:hypothetical protein
MGKDCEARAHHYVPQCWLAGFTDTGEKDGMLYVTDLKRRTQWRCKPSETGHRRDFYRVEDDTVADPLVIEKMFSKIENEVAPIFRVLVEKKRGPKYGSELEMLLKYMAIQWIRVPTFRAIVGKTVYSHFSEDVIRSPETWQQAKRRVGIPDGDPDTDYTRVKEAWDSGQIVFSGQPDFYLKTGAQMVEEIDTLLNQYKWNWLVSESGQFIGFDSPVAMDGLEGHAIGFKNAGVVIYPVNRHLLLYGTHEAVERPFLTTQLIARHNTFAMLSADEQVYSHRPDFHWLDNANKCQNNWRLFSETDFRE